MIYSCYSTRSVSTSLTYATSAYRANIDHRDGTRGRQGDAHFFKPAEGWRNGRRTAAGTDKGLRDVVRVDSLFALYILLDDAQTWRPAVRGLEGANHEWHDRARSLAGAGPLDLYHTSHDDDGEVEYSEEAMGARGRGCGRRLLGASGRQDSETEGREDVQAQRSSYVRLLYAVGGASPL